MIVEVSSDATTLVESGCFEGVETVDAFAIVHFCQRHSIFTFVFMWHTSIKPCNHLKSWILCSIPAHQSVKELRESRSIVSIFNNLCAILSVLL